MQETLKKAQNKAQTMVEKTKLQTSIATKTVQIDALYEELGKAVIDIPCVETNETAAPIVAQIREKEAEIQTLKDNLNALSNKTRCSCCGNYFDNEMIFCGHCGTKKPEPQPEEPVKEESFEEVTEEVVEETIEETTE